MGGTRRDHRQDFDCTLSTRKEVLLEMSPAGLRPNHQIGMLPETVEMRELLMPAEQGTCD
jgi:hypothetical protein